MTRWFASFIVLLIIIFGAKYIFDLRAENAANESKLIDERNRIEHLKKTVEEGERKLDLNHLEEKRRLENLEQLIIAKEKELESLESRISNLKQNPNAEKAKSDAQADVRLQKERVELLQNQIRILGESKGNRKLESKDNQRMIEQRFRTQDNNLSVQIKAAENTLNALESELKAIKVLRNDSLAMTERNSKAQEVVNQKAVLSDLRRQKRELVSQHAIQQNDLSSSLVADQDQVEKQMLTLKTQLRDEKMRFDSLQKALQSFANSESGVRNQIKVLESQKQNLSQQILDFKASR